MSRHLTDVLASGELDDYQPRPPGPSPIGLGWDVDAEICRESHCAASPMAVPRAAGKASSIAPSPGRAALR